MRVVQVLSGGAAALALWPWLSPVAAFGQEAASPPEHDGGRPVETLVVTGARTRALPPLDTRAVAPARELSDLLREIPGLSGSRMGGHGTDPAIRGLGQTRINVLLDGAFVHGACPNRMDPPTAYAPALGYDQVTVVKGVRSLERSGGPAGSILLERSRPDVGAHQRWAGEASTGVRSNSDGRELGADLAVGNERHFLRVLGSYNEASDYKDGAGERVRSGFEERSGAAILGLTPTPDWSLELSLEKQVLRDVLFAGAGMDSPESDQLSYRLKAERSDAGPLDFLRLELYRSEVDHVMDNFSLRTPPMQPLRAPSRSDTTGARLVAGWSMAGTDWQSGVDWQRNERQAERVNVATGALQSVLWPEVQLDQVGFFLEGTHDASNRAQIIYGLRYDHVRSNASEADVEPAGMALSANDLYAVYYGDALARTRREHNWSALLRWEQDLTRVPGMTYVGLSRTHRTADATERYIASNGMNPDARWVGNPGIDPEQHLQFEAGVVLRQAGWQLDGSVFLNRVDDYILRDRNRQPGNNATVYRNIDATLMGAEITVQRNWGAGWWSQAGLGYVRGENDTENRPLAQMPPLEGVVEIEYRQTAWQLGARWRGSARQSRVDLDPLQGSGLDVRKTPAWGVLDAYLQWQPAANLTLDVGIDNLLDKRYSQHLNRASAFDPVQIQVNEPGRSAWLKLRASL